MGKAFDYSLQAVLKSRKHMNYVSMIDRWERYWRVIERHTSSISKHDFNFKNKEIFELGCGPLFGWAPMALFLGAKRYYYIEPALQREVVESKEIKDTYFYLFTVNLCQTLGKKLTLRPFTKA